MKPILIEEEGNSRHALVIPLKNLPNYQENYLGMVAKNTDMTRVEIFQAVAQLADGLCDDTFTYEPLMEFLKRTTRLRGTRDGWPDSHEFILSLAEAIHRYCPANTKEIVYQRTTHGQLFLAIGIRK